MIDFNLTEDQQMLRTMARDFLNTESPRKLARLMTEDERGYPPDLWQKMARLGWMGLIIPEKYGGTGGSLLDMSVLLEEMGRACLPGPFFTSVVLGGLTLIEAADDDQKQRLLSGLVQGSLIFTLAVTEDGSLNPENIKDSAVAENGGYVLRGGKLFVPDAHIADYIICAARAVSGITLFLVDRREPGVTIRPLKTMAGDKQSEVVFDGVRVPAGNVLGGEGRGGEYLPAILEKAAALRSAEMLGGARQVLDMTVSYARDRVQFGRPIGSFQAIQHALANMFIDVESSSLVVYDAVWRLDNNLPASEEVSMAKALVSEAFTKAARVSHQVHGAIGFTRDHDLPLYFKRARAQEISLGSLNCHLDRIARRHGL